MALGKPLGDFATDFNSVYNIVQDVSGWDKIGIQVVAPFSGAISIYNTNDSGAVQGVTQGNAQLATNFNLAQVTNLATGTASTSISAAGNYSYTVSAQFLKIQGVPADTPTNVYKLLLFNSKVS